MDKKIIHEQCIELLGMIDTLNAQISGLHRDTVFTYIVYFRTLVEKANHKIEIKRMAIKRLELRYNNLIKQLKEVK